MKTGLVSISFRKLSPEEIIALVKRSGLGCIEWGGDVHVPAGEIETARRVGEMTRANGLEVACYGSYERLTEDKQLEAIVQTAKALGAPLIRVWAGRQGSAAADEEYRALIAANARKLAQLAMEENIAVAFEYHGNTLTDTADSALALLKAVDHPNMGSLWQPPVGMSTEDCVAGIRKVAPYLRNVHVFSWEGTQRLPLAERAEKWRTCLAEIAKVPGEHRLMMEFVRGDDPEQLLEDAACLARWTRGEWRE